MATSGTSVFQFCYSRKNDLNLGDIGSTEKEKAQLSKVWGGVGEYYYTLTLIIFEQTKIRVVFLNSYLINTVWYMLTRKMEICDGKRIFQVQFGWSSDQNYSREIQICGPGIICSCSSS